MGFSVAAIQRVTHRALQPQAAPVLRDGDAIGGGGPVIGDA